MKYFIIILFVSMARFAFGQTVVDKRDIINFYTAFDSVHKTTLKEDQLKIVQTVYVDRGSEGLKTFISWNGANTERWLNYMFNAKDYLMEMRPYMESVQKQLPIIEAKLQNLNKLYPNFVSGSIYFFVGVGFVGANPDGKNNIIIGTEKVVRKSEYFAIPIALHEFVHVQQKKGNGQLLTQVIAEGMADFISELLFGKDLAENGFAEHIRLGRKNEKLIWNLFKKDMFTLDNGFMGWLYGSKEIKGQEIQDLGYFMGYQICRSFYNTSPDKEKAIKQMLELDFNSNEAVKSFVLNSNYLTKEEKTELGKSEFTTKELLPKITEKKVVGYAIKGKNVIFSINIPTVAAPQNVSVAGSFNNWNRNDTNYIMAAKKKNIFELKVPKSNIGKGLHQFKFVINGDIWLPVPDHASNIDLQAKDKSLLLMID